MKKPAQRAGGRGRQRDWVSALEHLAEQRLKRGEVGIIDSLLTSLKPR